jgi:UDP-N-acetyl-D-mannosaminuronic acid dehydrogenase
LKKICVLGLGYIGLPTAAMFGTHGYQVVGVDVNERVVEMLGRGDIHIEEPGLRTLVTAALRSGNLTVQSQPEPADVFIIAVPTPLAHGEHAADSVVPLPKADLTYVRSAAEAIAPHLRRGNLVVLESTSPPGTTEQVLCPILETTGLKVGRDLFVAHSPERVLPGRVLEELVSNDRVIGGVDQPLAQVAQAIYASFVQGQIFITDATTAEMVKLMENTYRDVNIVLANEFALMGERVGIDAWEAIRLANRHPRVNILRPGPGVGGHCIAVDPWFIVEAAPEDTTLIQSARRRNDGMPGGVVHRVIELLGSPGIAEIAILGIAYKADVDDARESPAVDVARELARRGYGVRITDPHVQTIPGSEAAPRPLAEAVAGADCLLLLTDHTAYRELDPTSLATAMRQRVVVDTRHCLDLAAWRRAGFRTALLGDGVSLASPQHERTYR